MSWRSERGSRSLSSTKSSDRNFAFVINTITKAKLANCPQNSPLFCGTFRRDCTASGKPFALELSGGTARTSPTRTIILLIKPSGRAGRFLGYLGDELIVTSRHPFLDGARALLARGYDPATPYNMRHANSDVLSFVTTTIGHAAGLSINADRTRFQKFVPFEGHIKEAAE